MSEGAASFEYQLLLSGGTVKITVEAGEVLKRNKTPLSSVLVSPSLWGRRLHPRTTACVAGEERLGLGPPDLPRDAPRDQVGAAPGIVQTE
jgi:hypothetical protein